jgi:hypothetical protein
MSWKEILKIAPYERAVAEEFASEDIKDAKKKQIEGKIIDLYETYISASQSDYDKRIRALDTAQRLFDSVGLPDMVSPYNEREENIKAFEDYLNVKNRKSGGKIRKSPNVIRYETELIGMIDTLKEQIKSKHLAEINLDDIVDTLELLKEATKEATTMPKDLEDAYEDTAFITEEKDGNIRIYNEGLD